MKPIKVANTMPTTETTERVEEPDQEYAQERVRAGIRDQRLIDVETGVVREEAEAGGNMLVLEVGAGVGDDFIGNPAQDRSEGKLDGDAVPACLAPQHAPDLQRDLGRGFASLDAHRRERGSGGISGSAGRIGDRPCSRDC
ncbi:hypothetical protein ACVWZ6_005443 [Bradyrhizobium sp. GM6.1]